MVLIAYKNDEIISAQEATKGTYKCIACKSDLCYVSVSKTSKIERISHFRHKIECEYSNKINEKPDLTSSFNLKWTLDLVKAQYLYQYWGNKNIADIINKEGKIIIVKNSLLKYAEYINKDVIWILNTEKRPGEIYKIIYDNGEEECIYRTDKRYDLALIPKNHKVYLDMGLNELIEITNVSIDKISCRLILVEDFLNQYFKDIIKKELEYEDICVPYQIFNGYKELENIVYKINKEVSKKVTILEKKKKEFFENLEEYIETYDNKTNKAVKIIVIRTTHNYAGETNVKIWILKDDERNPLDFFIKIIELHTESNRIKYQTELIKHEEIEIEMFFNTREKCEKCNGLKYEQNINNLKLMNISPKNIMKKDEIENVKTNYCKISDTKKESSMTKKKISFSSLLDYYKNISVNNDNIIRIKKKLTKYLYNLFDVEDNNKDIKCYKCNIYKKMKKCIFCNKNYINKLKDTSITEINELITKEDKILMKKYHKDCYKEYLLEKCNKECELCHEKILNNNIELSELEEIDDKNVNILLFHQECYEEIEKIKKETALIRREENIIFVKGKCSVCKNNLLEKGLSEDDLIRAKDLTNDELMEKYHEECHKEQLYNKLNLSCMWCKEQIKYNEIKKDEISKLSEIEIMQRYHKKCNKKYLTELEEAKGLENLINKIIKKYNNKCGHCKKDCLNIENTKREDIKKLKIEENKIYHNSCFASKIIFERCNDCDKKLETEKFENKKTKYCVDCYKNKMIGDYSSGCGYCKQEIINKDMDICEINEMLKNTTPFNKNGLTYHCNCFSEKIKNDKVTIK